MKSTRMLGGSKSYEVGLHFQVATAQQSESVSQFQAAVGQYHVKQLRMSELLLEHRIHLLSCLPVNENQP